MPNEKEPEIAELHAATNIALLASVLLRASDATVLKFASLYFARCAKLSFLSGHSFVTARIMILVATRDAHGLVDSELAQQCEDARVAISRIAAGEVTDDQL